MESNTASKYHPILFSTPMVQAIQEGRKTQTRRTKGLEQLNSSTFQFRYDGFDEEYGNHCIEFLDDKGNPTEKYKEIECPYNVGDVLWVRESYHRIHDAETDLFLRFGYKADKDYKGTKWNPSIHMPKKACRIFLKIKSIRAERLQEISEEDIKAEGVVIPKNGDNILWELGKDNSAFSFMDKAWKKGLREYHSSKEVFFVHWAELWCKINGKDSWNKNPFVWVYEFERIEKPNDFI